MLNKKISKKAILGLLICCCLSIVVKAQTNMLSNKSKAWVLGNKISIAAIQNALHADQTKTDGYFNQAAAAAKDLGITLPPLPTQTNSRSESNFLLRYYLLSVDEPIRKILEVHYGTEEAAFFDLGLNLNFIYWLFLDGDAQTLKLLLPDTLKIIKVEVSKGKIPAEMAANTINLQVSSNYAEAEETVIDLQSKITGYLLKRQPVDIGDVYYVRHQYAEAIKEYSNAINANADFAEAYSKRGAALMSLESYDLAIADYTKFIGLAPKDQEAALNLDTAYIHLCTAYLLKDDLIAAELNCTHAIRIKPGRDAYFMRGLVHLMQAKYPSALDDFTVAIVFDTNDAKSYYYRGLTYQKAGRKDLSVADYKKAETLQPGILASYQAN